MWATLPTSSRSLGHRDRPAAGPAERPLAGTMARPPRPRTAHLFDRGVLGRAFGFLGPVEAAISLALLPIGAALFVT